MTRAKVEAIGQIGLTVKDLGAAKEFYGQRLGLPFLFDAGSMAFYECDGVRLMLGTAEAGMQSPNGGTILYFKVAQLKAACAELAELGVSMVQDAHLVAKMPDYELCMAFVKDPDGNVVGLMEEVR